MTPNNLIEEFHEDYNLEEFDVEVSDYIINRVANYVLRNYDGSLIDMTSQMWELLQVYYIELDC